MRLRKTVVAVALGFLAVVVVFGLVLTLTRKDTGWVTPGVGQRTKTIDLGSGVTMEFVLIPAGWFNMGSVEGIDNAAPQHRVRITRPFYLGKHEVTQAQYQAVMGANPSFFKGDNLPVDTVSWDDAQEFCKRLSQKEGRTYRLPTEAEWEYAARGGSHGHGTEYAGSGNLDEVAWYDGNSGRKPHPVGQKKPNELGLYDMSGNVWEWCFDWVGSYASGSVTDPVGPDSGSYRIIRGGGYLFVPSNCRVASRCSSGRPSIAKAFVGFRVALAPAVKL